MSELSRNEHIKEASDYLRGTLAEGLTDEITGAIVEDDQQLVKFHGMYLQDDRDLRGERGAQEAREGVRLHAARAHLRRRAHHQAVARARLDRARLRQRHDARDHAPDHPAARRHQVEPESDLEGDRRATAEHDCGLRRREPQRDEQSQSVPVEGARRRARARARDFGPSDAAHRRLSRDLARRREDRGRRAR